MRVRLDMDRIRRESGIDLPTTRLADIMSYVLSCLCDDHPAIYSDRYNRSKKNGNARSITAQGVQYILNNANDSINTYYLGILLWIHGVQELDGPFVFDLPKPSDFKVDPLPVVTSMILRYNRSKGDE